MHCGLRNKPMAGELQVSMVLAVAALQGMGWHLFPIKPSSKEPLTKHGHRDATNDMATLRAWWERWPEANIGVACGPSGLVVVDIDNLEAFGAVRASFPATLTSITGSGGYHLIYRARPDIEYRPSVGRLPGYGPTPGVDLRAGSSYIVAPPSRHPNGTLYRWMPAKAYLPVLAPEWLRPEAPRSSTEPTKVSEPTRYAAAALRKSVERIKAAQNGERNHTLNKNVFGLRKLIEAGHLDKRQVEEEATKAALQIGLSRFEAERTIGSALRDLSYPTTTGRLS